MELKLLILILIALDNKLDQLYTEFSSYDIICVSETKLNQNILNQDLELHGFHLPIRKDREENNGGGLLIYIKRNVHFERRQDLESNEIENIWAEVTCHQKKFLLGLFYRPPESPSEYWNLFENNIDIATDTNMDMLIMGDFNHDMLKFNPNSKLLRILTKYNIQNMINEPTRITQKSQTCIDLILTNHSSIIINTEVLPPFCSDHCSITAEVNFKTYKAQAYKQTIWKYNNANKIALNEKLIATDWSFINNSNDIDYINEKFNNTLLAAANDCIPKVTFTRRPSDKPWMNNEIRSQMRQRNRLYYKAKNSQSEDHFRKFKDNRNQVTTLIHEAKNNYFQKLQTSLADPNTKPKQWYKIANEITKLKNKSNPPPPLVSNGNINIHPLDKAERLNKHFANISKIENPPPLPEIKQNTNFSFKVLFKLVNKTLKINFLF